MAAARRSVGEDRDAVLGGVTRLELLGLAAQRGAPDGRRRPRRSRPRPRRPRTGRGCRSTLDLRREVGRRRGGEPADEVVARAGHGPRGVRDAERQLGEHGVVHADEGAGDDRADDGRRCGRRSRGPAGRRRAARSEPPSTLSEPKRACSRGATSTEKTASSRPQAKKTAPERYGDMSSTNGREGQHREERVVVEEGRGGDRGEAAVAERLDRVEQRGPAGGLRLLLEEAPRCTGSRSPSAPRCRRRGSANWRRRAARRAAARRPCRGRAPTRTAGSPRRCRWPPRRR